MPAQTAWGLDIGESFIKAVKMARVREYLEITRVDMIPIGTPGGGEETSIDRETMLISALEEFVRRHDPSDSRVIASIQGRNTFCKLINLPPVERKRIPEIVRFEVKQQIPFPIEDIVWDYVESKEEYAPGEEIEVNLVAIRKEIVENFVETSARAGVKLDGLQATPLALFNLVKYELAPRGNVVVIDVGAELTDLVIVEGNRFWPRTLGIAGKHITKALEEKFEIPHEEAEALKLDVADSKHYQKIFSVIKPVLKDLVTEIHRTIGYYKSLSRDVTFDKIIFLGNATKLAGFEKFFGENLPYKIEVIQGLRKVRVSRRVNLKAFKEYLPGFGVAVGLAIQGLKEAKCQVSLLPDEISGKMRPGKMIGMAAALLFLALSIPAGLVTANVALGGAERKAAAMGENKPKIPEIQDVKKAHDTAVAQIAEMKKIQEETRRKYLKPYDTVDLPLHVLRALDELVPRGSLEETIKSKGDEEEIWRDERDKVYIISVDYQNIIEEAASTPRSRGRGAPRKVRQRKVTVQIKGLVWSKGTGDETTQFINENLVDKLNRHWLSAPLSQLLTKADYEKTLKDVDKWARSLPRTIRNRINLDELKDNLSLHYVTQESFKKKMKYEDPKNPAMDPYRYHKKLVDMISRIELPQPADLPTSYPTSNFWDDGKGKSETSTGEFVVFTVKWRIDPAAMPPQH